LAAVAAPTGNGRAAAETGSVPFTFTVGVPLMPTLHAPLWATDCAAGNATVIVPPSRE